MVEQSQQPSKVFPAKSTAGEHLEHRQAAAAEAAAAEAAALTVTCCCCWLPNWSLLEFMLAKVWLVPVKHNFTSSKSQSVFVKGNLEFLVLFGGGNRFFFPHILKSFKTKEWTRSHGPGLVFWCSNIPVCPRSLRRGRGR